MSFATALPHPAALLDQQAADAQRYRALLHELMDMGMGMARSVHGQATAGTRDPAAAHEAARAFDLLSRAVCRTVALARRVTEPLPQRADPAQRRSVRDVKDVRQWSDSELDAALDAEAAEALHAELSERLDAPELGDEIGTRPTAEVVAGICRDLGLGRLRGTHPWTRRTPADVAALCERAARAPDSPPCPAPAGPAQGWSETWRPQPYTEEIGAELAPQLRALAPRIRGP